MVNSFLEKTHLNYHTLTDGAIYIMYGMPIIRANSKFTQKIKFCHHLLTFQVVPNVYEFL